MYSKSAQNETNEYDCTIEIEIKRKQCEQQSLHQMVLQKKNEKKQKKTTNVQTTHASPAH